MPVNFIETQLIHALGSKKHAHALVMDIYTTAMAAQRFCWAALRSQPRFSVCAHLGCYVSESCWHDPIEGCPVEPGKLHGMYDAWIRETYDQTTLRIHGLVFEACTPRDVGVTAAYLLAVLITDPRILPRGKRWTMAGVGLISCINLPEKYLTGLTLP